jgi:hypothetical protein
MTSAIWASTLRAALRKRNGVSPRDAGKGVLHAGQGLDTGRNGVSPRAAEKIGHSWRHA